LQSMPTEIQAAASRSKVVQELLSAAQATVRGETIHGKSGSQLVEAFRKSKRGEIQKAQERFLSTKLSFKLPELRTGTRQSELKSVSMDVPYEDGRIDWEGAQRH
jgi:hypothetical protein